MINIRVSVQAISSKETNIQKLNCYLKYIYIYISFLSIQTKEKSKSYNLDKGNNK